VEEHDSAGVPLGASEIDRKSFLQRGAVAAGGLIVLGRVPGATTAHAAASGAVDYAPAALSTAEMAALKAAVARLLPADDLGPGAVEANVHIFIDRELSGYYKELLPLYQQNLADLDAAAKKAGAASFADLATDKQDALLQQAEAGKLGTGWAGFFQLLLEHTREGMFSDPMYGGNKNFAGWDLIGYPGLKLVYTAQEQSVGTKVALTHTSVATYGGHPYE
jgi:gluconate 2-dehydrogenase gamma chain